jgi:large subunit ribosomal protein L9
MPLEVILLEDVKGLGRKNDVVKVKEGYAQNMLFPRHLAEPATEGKVRDIERRKADTARKEAQQRQAAEALAKKLAGVGITIKATAGANGKLFGSITASQVGEELARQGLVIDKRDIVMKEPIKTLGIHKITVHIMQNLKPEITVNVVAE